MLSLGQQFFISFNEAEKINARKWELLLVD